MRTTQFSWSSDIHIQGYLLLKAFVSWHAVEAVRPSVMPMSDTRLGVRLR